MNWLIIIMLAAIAGFSGFRKAGSMAATGHRLDSQPQYHAAYTSLWVIVPTALLLLAFNLASDQFIIRGVADYLPSAIKSAPSYKTMALERIGAIRAGSPYKLEADASLTQAIEYMNSKTKLRDICGLLLAGIAAAILSWLAVGRLTNLFPARARVEKFGVAVLGLASFAAILVTAMIVLSVAFESFRFFSTIPVSDFLFGLHWSPQIALRADQAGSSGGFGAVPLFAGTLLITLTAMMVAAPLGLMSAIYMSEYASKRVRAIAKPTLEILAGIPTVVYGYFAALAVAPFIKHLGGMVWLDVDSESALAAGLVMGVMILPFVSSLADDVIHAIPQTIRDGAMALGSTKSETIIRVVLPAATPGIISAMLLAISRAIGETMIVLMAAGLAANLTFNPLQSATTVTVQIVTLLVGDQEFDSPKTLAAFALGMTLFVATLILNLIALRIVKNYRRKYA